MRGIAIKTKSLSHNKRKGLFWESMYYRRTQCNHIILLIDKISKELTKNLYKI